MNADPALALAAIRSELRMLDHARITTVLPSDTVTERMNSLLLAAAEALTARDGTLKPHTTSLLKEAAQWLESGDFEGARDYLERALY